MKKGLIIIALLACVGLAAQVAFAIVQGTKHDLSNQTAPLINTAGTNDEICVVCHTPHGASANYKQPLWNHSPAADETNYSPYANGLTGTLDSTPPADLSGTVTALCLSCHDGSTAPDDVINPPNDNPGMTIDDGVGGILDDVVPRVLNATSNAMLGTDLTDDHPVGMVFNAALEGLDGELRDVDVYIPTGISGCDGVAETIEDCMLFGSAGASRVECASCHDVHDNTNPPFLRSNNIDSALCTTCHLK